MACGHERLRRCAPLLALVAFLELPLAAAEAIESKEDPAGESALSRDRKTAEDLYNATSADAQTF